MTTPSIESHSLFQCVSDFIRTEHLLDGISSLDIALSGGADSVCLLAILSAMKLDCALRAHHIRHHLRQNDDVDASIARENAQKLGVMFIQTDLDWYESGIPENNVENEARKRRYSAFFDALKTQKCRALALAHHGDENVETAIWRLGRGCGLEGMGMQARTVREGVILIRPLLMVSKDAIYAFLRDNGLAWAEDPSNQSDDYRRNRIRHDILPLIKAESMSDECLFRSLYQIRCDADSMSSLADCFVSSHPVKAGGWFCNWHDWNCLSKYAQQQVLRHAVRCVVSGYCPASQFIMRGIAMIEQQKQTFRQLEDGQVHIGWSHGGVMVWSENETVRLPVIHLNYPCDDVKIWNFCVLSCFASTPESELKNTTSVFHLDASCAEGKLTIVSADQFREVRNSVGNIIRLREALRSQGVPDMWRSYWPVLCCDGRPLWVLGGMRTMDAHPACIGKRALTFMVRWL